MVHNTKMCKRSNCHLLFEKVPQILHWVCLDSINPSSTKDGIGLEVADKKLIITQGLVCCFPSRPSKTPHTRIRYSQHCLNYHEQPWIINVLMKPHPWRQISSPRLTLDVEQESAPNLAVLHIAGAKDGISVPQQQQWLNQHWKKDANPHNTVPPIP